MGREKCVFNKSKEIGERRFKRGIKEVWNDNRVTTKKRSTR